eukprot:gene22160-28267_t
MNEDDNEVWNESFTIRDIAQKQQVREMIAGGQTVVLTLDSAASTVLSIEELVE